MPDFTAKIEDNKCVIFNGSIISVIEFDRKQLTASLIVGNVIYPIEPGKDKNMRVLENGTEVIKFKFDYWWGGATLIINGEESNYQITGKAFKKGTRLVDGDKKDMVVVTTASIWVMKEFNIKVLDPQVTDFMMAITVYYHIYASVGKMRAAMI